MMMPNCIREPAGRRWAWLGVLACAAGCSVTDGEAPGKPRFDLAPGPVFTRSARIDLAGTAEYGAKLVLARTPPATIEPVTADPWAGTFVFRGVALEPGKNTFSLVATDEADNPSEAATIEVTFEDQPSELRLTLSTTLLAAGTSGGRGTLDATAELLGAEQGYTVGGREVTFAVQGVATRELKATTDGRGFATVTFTGLDKAGQGKVTAAVAGLTAERGILVTGGLPAALTLTLSPAGSTDAGSEALTIAAGGEVVANVAVKDAGANPVDAPIQLYTDAPGAFVEGRKLTHLFQAGTFRVVAAVTGAATDGALGVSGAATLSVGAAAASALTLGIAPSAQAGTALPWTVALADAYGNAAVAAGTQTVVVATDDPQGEANQGARTVTFRTAGPQVVRATLSDGTTSAVSSRTVIVAPGAPTAVTLSLEAADQKPQTPELDVKAGANAYLTVHAAVRDAFGNPGASPVVLETDAVATFEGSVLRGLSRAGRFTVRAGAADAPVDASTDFFVVAADAAAIDLRLASASAVAGVPAAYSAAVVDAWGNATEDAVALTVDGLTDAATVTGTTLTIRQAGTWTVRASPTTGTTPAASTTPVVVSPAAPASVSVDVGPQNTARAGENPLFSATVRDSYGNSIAGAPLQLWVVPQPGTVVTGPGPFVSAGKIYNLTKPGQYKCLAQVSGTSLTNDLNDPEALLVVTAADAASLDLVLSRPSVESGSPLDFRADVRDAWGNPVALSPVVTVGRNGEANPPVVLSPWTAGAPGSWTMTATLAVPGTATTLTDVEVFSVVAATDVTPPVLQFGRPVAEPTVASWPAPGQLSPGCGGNPNGDTATLVATDPSLVERLWLGTGGLLTTQPAAPTLAFPESPVAVTVQVCDSVTDRGEVIVDAAALDTRGNFARASASWCVDPGDANTDGQPDFLAYQPANSPASRCRVYKDPGTQATNIRALAASARGNLVLVREGASQAAVLHRFVRAGGPYGLGPARALVAGGTAWKLPLGTAVSGSTALSSVGDGSDSALVRTRDVFIDGATDEVFVRTTHATGRFGGVVLTGDGAALATWAARDGATDRTGAVYRFPGALDAATTYTGPLPTTPCASATGACLAATSANVRLAGLCQGSTADTFFVYGIKGAGAGYKAAVLELSGGALAEKWIDADASARDIGGCALTSQGLALTLYRAGTAAGLVTLLDLGPTPKVLAAVPLLSGWANGTALDRPMGVALHQGRLFVGVNEPTSGAGSLVRFARDGGF